MVPDSMWIVLAVCAIACSIGFYKFYYFLSVGYGLAISGAGIALLILFGKALAPISIHICILLIIYGIRLSGFLLIREVKSASYRKKIVEPTSNKKAPIFVKVALWICVSLMYVAQVSPIFYHGYNGDHPGLFTYLGFIIMLVGLLVESHADMIKSNAKKRNPNRFCDEGLYKIVRCPNYFGEILFWSGVLIVGIDSLQGIQWILSLIGYSLIIYVMLSGAKRLENRQDRSYGNDPEYQKYVNNTPILFPLVPIYHLKDCKFIIE